LNRAGGGASWYANAVPFDSRATTPTCGADTLCFDSARFVVGDFDGDGRADLMAVTPRNGGSAFWLLRSTGSGFAAPVLWFQSDGRMPADRVQQYMSSSAADTPRASILVTVQQSAGHVELWTVGANETGIVEQTRVLDDNRLHGNVKLLAVKSAHDDASTFVAVQRAEDRRHISVTTLRAASGHWTIEATSVLPSQFELDTTRFAIDDSHAGKDPALVMTVPHFAEPGGVDVWRWRFAHAESAPVLLGYLRDRRWADAAPSIVQDGSGRTLVFYERIDAILSNTLFTAGNAALARYSFNENDMQIIPMGLSQLPAMYSETLWRERLTQ
jgi:hypothetical protein